VKKKELLPTYFCFWKPSKRCSAGCVGRGGDMCCSSSLCCFSFPHPHLTSPVQNKQRSGDLYIRGLLWTCENNLISTI
jgi:hypothetical protein